MKLSIEVQSYDTCGGALSTTLAGEFLWEQLRGLEPDTLEIVVTACFRSRGKPARSMAGTFRDYHKSLSTLPKLRYSPKRERVEIQYLTQQIAEDVLEASEPQLQAFRTTVREVAALLPEILGAHKVLRKLLPMPQLDAAITEALAHLPATEEAMQAFDVAQQGRVLAEQMLRSPWEKLGVDWTEYHPEARELLDDPFFWDAVDEYAPHGNDTGADLLEAFREWRRKHRQVPASRFLPLMLKRWNYSADVDALLGKPMSEWDEDDELTMEVLDEATIAIAFAQMKLEGRCDEDVRAAALASIARQLDPAVHAHFEWTVPKDRIDRLQLVQAKLRG